MGMQRVEKPRSPTARFIALLILALALATLASCRDFSFLGELGELPRSLELVPAAVTLDPGQTIAFSATGGMAPYTYTNPGSSGTIDPATGVYIASIPGTDTIQVADAKGITRQAVITVNAWPSLTVFPSAPTVARNQSITLIAAGGRAPYTFLLTGNSSGGSVIQDGPYDGTYTAGSVAGVSDEVTVTDNASPSNSLVVPIAVTGLATNVNYEVVGDIFPGTGEGGAAVSGGTFTIRNVGTADGQENISWAVYLSTDGTLSSGDRVLCSGSESPLPAVTGTGDVSLAGTWPLEGGTWHLLVAISAVDDLILSAGAYDGGTVVLSQPDVDYEVTSVVQSAGSTLTGGSVEATFIVKNNGSIGGRRGVLWKVYANTVSTLSGSPVLVAAGSRLPVAAGAAVSETVTGNWPAVPGSYFLIVRVEAEDFAAGHQLATTIPIPVVPSNVNYAVSAANLPPAGEAGAPVGNVWSFTIANTGIGNGTRPISWTVYVSTDGIVSSGDAVLCHGAQLPLPATSDAVVILSGTWPDTQGATVRLIVQLSAEDDPYPSDNTLVGGVLTLSVPDVNYIVSEVNYVSGSLMPGQTVDGNFRYGNSGGSEGTQTVSWAAYASKDQNLDSSDSFIAAGGGLIALGSGTVSPLIPFSGTWPGPYGAYYLLVRVWAGDDVDTTNNTGHTLPFQTIGLVTESEPNGDCVGLVDVDDLGIMLRPGMSVRISGDMSSGDVDDVFRFNTGTAGSINFSITWTGVSANGDFYVYDTTNHSLTGYGILSTQAVHWTWTVDMPGAWRWIDFRNSENKNLGSYTLTISAME